MAFISRDSYADPIQSFFIITTAYSPIPKVVHYDRYNV